MIANLGIRRSLSNNFNAHFGINFQHSLTGSKFDNIGGTDKLNYHMVIGVSIGITYHL